MKIIHSADLHLGSSFAELSDEIKKQRRAELLDNFSCLVQYAKDNDIKIILLAGDVFDNDKVKKSDKEYFYGVIENNPEIDFIYLRGNHDIKSSIERDDLLNLKLFNNKWTTYYYGNVAITGLELNESNSKVLYDTLTLKSGVFNIVMLHGQESSSIINANTDIIINKLKDKNIDYIALGHVHSYFKKSLDNKTTYAYPGCLEGRGFDETGEKGFILIDSEKKEYSFVNFAKRQIYKISVDISQSSDIYNASLLVEKNIENIDKNSLLQIVLIGKVKYDFSLLKNVIETKFKNKFMFLDVKNKVYKEVLFSDYQNDMSLKGEVIREILNEDFDEESKNEIISNCLKLLNKEEIEI